MALPDYMVVQLQLLDACNLKCSHCYNADAAASLGPSTAEVKSRLDAIFAFARRNGFEPDIHLSGGEPTLRKDLVEIVEHVISSEGDGLLFTNGTCWTEQLAQSLYGAGLRYVQVSLEGPEPLTNEVRGPGVFGQAMQTLGMLGQMGFRCTVSITLTARNFDPLFGFVEQLDAQLGPLHFHLREVFPLGAGSALMGLDAEQRRALYEWAVKWSGNSTVGLEDPAHCSVDRHYAEKRRGCVAGRMHFCVEVDGSVQPCRPLPLVVGTVDDLDAAWSSPVMERIRAREFGGRCGRCEIAHNCGGCRVYPFLDGDVFGEDRRCFAPQQGLVRTPTEAMAIGAARAVGQQMWRARCALRNLLE